MSLVYSGRYTREISFPLGGIGTGCVGLGGDGRLRDWEIFNRPNKGSINGFSHFAIKAEKDGEMRDARFLHSDLPPPHSGTPGTSRRSFGFGARMETLAGVPHFREAEFVGEFPVATIRFVDSTFPGAVVLSAFNPFIPLDEDNSSLPAAFFEISIRNTTDSRLSYTVAGSLTNPAPAGNSRHDIVQSENATILVLDAPKTEIDDPVCGALAIGTDIVADSDTAYQQYWYRGRWFDGLGVYWRDFTAPGLLRNRVYDTENTTGKADSAALARRIHLEPGESGSIRFIVSWYYPNCHRYWPAECGDDDSSCACDASTITWRNHYATRFRSANDVAAYGLSNWNELQGRTAAFRDVLHESSMPPEVIDAVSANISILKTPTTLRLTDGSFYGFEGCDVDAGCCDGSCSHVWNYAYALPYLFPKLERSMRDLEFTYNQRNDGQLAFRLQLPIGSARSRFRACVDGQYGTVLKTYREWKISGDTQWLAARWPAVKRAIEFAWAVTNNDRWDPDKRGIITGRQHHTLDMELFGPNSWLTGFYLAGLKAGAEIADQIGDSAAAIEYREIFARGKTAADQSLFNGEYYQQIIDLDDRSVVEKFHDPHDVIHRGGDIFDAYWDPEHGEIKHQISGGSAVDQVVAQWHANLLGLGEIFDPHQTKSALRAIYRYNFKRSVRFHFNPCRIFCLNDEAATIICEWPEGTRKPYVPIPYAEESLHGCEYQAACHMIQVGLVEEGLELVRAVRDRYDGEKRNPWNEMECGSNYARSMASYALLLAYSGFGCDMSRNELRFDPILGEGSEFRSLWSVGSAWGSVLVSDREFRLRILEGSLQLAVLRVPFLHREPRAVQVDSGENPVDMAYTWTEGVISFSTPVKVPAGASMLVIR